MPASALVTSRCAQSPNSGADLRCSRGHPIAVSDLPQTIAAMAQAQRASPVRSLLMNTRINVLLQQRGVIIVPQDSTVEQALQVCALELQQEWCI
jgi:hypothetical protein